MRSIPRHKVKAAVPASLGLAVAAVLLDNYFGSGGGGLGAVFLGLFAMGGLAAEGAAGISVLRHPRTLDLAFISGADWEWRRRNLQGRLLRMGTKLAMVVIPAAFAMILWQHPPLADSLLLIGITAGALPLAGLLAWTLIPLVRPSRSPFPDSAPIARPWFSGWSRESIRLSARMAGAIERAIPEPWATLAGRKARYFLRKEGDVMAGALVAYGVLGAALVTGGGVTYVAAGTLVAATLAFAWFRLQSAHPDACLRDFTPCPTPPRLAYQADLCLAGILAAGLLGFAVPAFFWLEGVGCLSDPRCHQVVLNVIVLAQLAAADNRRPAMGANTALVLNLGYLALSGTLFMFPSRVALATLAATLALSHAQVARGLRTR